MNFPGGPPGRNLNNRSLIFDCFFIVNHQATGGMPKNDGVCTTCYTRLKIDHIYPKMFFANFAQLLQNNEMMRTLMLCIIFVIFAKMSNFFRGGYVGKYGAFFTNFALFFCCCTSIIRRNEQNCGGVYDLYLAGKKWFTLPENFFRKVCTLFVKYCNSTYFDVVHYFLVFLQT